VCARRLACGDKPRPSGGVNCRIRPARLVEDCGEIHERLRLGVELLRASNTLGRSGCQADRLVMLAPLQNLACWRKMARQQGTHRFGIW